MKISIALIHNNDEKRLSRIRPDINRLVFKLEDKMSVGLYEVSWQPELKPTNLRLAITKDFMHWNLNREWNKYKGSKNKIIIFDLFIFIIKLFKNLTKNKDTRKKYLTASTIELFLTHKHISTYYNALENESDYLLVFEDDAVFKNDSINNLENLIEMLEKEIKTPAYVDLAGGCEINKLKVNALEINRDKKFIYYSKPITNTACCYLINKKQLEMFGSFISRTPELNYIKADWMLNNLFILQEKNNPLSFCKHAYPTIFGHGSITGEFKSKIR